MTPRQSDTVTIREVYQLVDTKVSQVQSSQQRLETKVDNMMNVTISQLESKVANLEGRATVIPFLISTALGIISIALSWVAGHSK